MLVETAAQSSSLSFAGMSGSFLCGSRIAMETRHQWLILVILANQKAEIRRILVRSQPGQIVLKTLS
jgi:hypothetical protein